MLPSRSPRGACGGIFGGVRCCLGISTDGVVVLCWVLAFVGLCCPLLFLYAYYRVFLRLIALPFLLFPIQQGGALQLTLTARCIFAYENPLALTGAGFLAKRLMAFDHTYGGSQAELIILRLQRA